MNAINVQIWKKIKIYILSVLALMVTVESFSQKVYFIDLACYLNATSMRLKNVSEIYGTPIRIGNSTVDVTLLSNFSYKNTMLTVGLGWKEIETNIEYSFSASNRSSYYFYAASSIYMKNDYLTMPIAYEIQLVDLENATYFYCRPSASLNIILTNKRLFYRTFNYKHAEEADAAFVIFDKTKFGSFLQPTFDFGIKTGQNRYVIDCGVRINSSIKHLYGEFANGKASVGLFLGLGYKFN